MSKATAIQCDEHGTRAKLLERLNRKPDASIEDLCRHCGQSRSNTWHHLRILEKRGVTIHGKPLTELLNKLIEHSNFLRREGAKHRHKSTRAHKPNRAILQERMNQVVANAQRHLSDDAISYKTANGITVVVKQEHHWISIE